MKALILAAALLIGTNSFALHGGLDCNSEVKIAAAQKAEATIGGKCSSKKLGKGVCMLHISSLVSRPSYFTYKFAIQPGPDCVVQIIDLTVTNPI